MKTYDIRKFTWTDNVGVAEASDFGPESIGARLYPDAADYGFEVIGKRENITFVLDETDIDVMIFRSVETPTHPFGKFTIHILND